MKRTTFYKTALIFIQIHVCVILCLGQSVHQSKSISPIKIASYNIRCDVVADDKSGNSWEIRKYPLIDLILDKDFDMVGIQEPYENQIDDLNDLLDGYDNVSAPYATKSFLAIYFKNNKFKVLDEGMFWLSETPDRKSMGWDADEYRIVHWAKFSHLNSGIEFYCFNSHYYWKRVTARKNSGPLTAKMIEEIAGDKPVIFLGDLNSTPNTSQIKSLSRKLNDAFENSTIKPVGPENTNLGGGKFTGNPHNRIDYIFVSQNIKVLDFYTYDDKYENSDGKIRYPSDHLPISANILLSE